MSQPALWLVAFYAVVMLIFTMYGGGFATIPAYLSDLFDTKFVGNKFTGEAVCNFGGSTMRSKSVMTLTGDTAYRTEAHATFDPPMGGMTQSDTVIEGRNIGACKSGQQPGDITMPNGQTMNIRNIMGGGTMGGGKK